MRKSLLLFLLLLAACGPDAAPDKKAEKEAQPGVTLSAAEIKSLGIETRPAQAASFRREITGYGVVTALDAIAQSDADYAMAAAAAAQSAAAAARARSLGAGEEAAVSREVVEAAVSKAAADQASLALAERKAGAAFGIHPPWRSPQERAAIMRRLSSGQTVLVRVTFPLGSLPAGLPSSLQIRRLGGAQNWTARTIWEAPADPAFPGRGFYALIDGSDLAQNEHVVAAVPVGPAQSGVVVPSASLLLSEGEASVYLQTAPGHYARTRIGTDKPVENGYFVPSGITQGQQIVTSGAGILLAHEVNPSSSAGGD
jgi:hypothetical protein